MQNFPTQLSEALSDLLPDSPLPEIPIKKCEPDLDDLDQLLEESMLLCKKSTNRRVYKEVKQNTDDLVESFKQVAWDVLEHIEVWNMTHCKCGGLGTLIFCRYMRKMQKVGSKALHWETVKELPAGCKPRFALVTREVERCEFCVGLEIEKFENFQEVVK